MKVHPPNLGGMGFQGSSDFAVGNHFETPTPTYKAKNEKKKKKIYIYIYIFMVPKVSSLPYFEAFWVIFGPGVCSYFCLVCGGAGVTRAFLITCLPTNSQTLAVKDFHFMACGIRRGFS